MAYFSDRRTFLKNSAAWVITVPALPGLANASALLQPEPAEGAAPDDLQRAFLEPPEAAWPWVYWMVTDGTLTKEGITADLEAMHRVGIRGLIYMENDLLIPKGPVRFMTPEWREMIQHAVKEATRLGITVNMNDDGGYSGSGGPWITPELSMQMLTFSETAIEGPKAFAGSLQQPKSVKDYYRDIAVLAFPRPGGESVRMAERSPRITCSVDRKEFDSANLIDGNPNTTAIVPLPEKGLTQYLNIDFPEPFTAQCLTIALDAWNRELPAAIEVSDDGQTYRTIREFSIGWPMSAANFPQVTARFFRIRVSLPEPGSDWVFNSFAKGIPISEVEFHAHPRIEDLAGKAAYVRKDAVSGDPGGSPEWIVPREKIVDLSSRMTSDGRLTWDVPAGNWTVVRIGHTSTGKMNHPAPKESIGLECDKLSKRAVEVQFENFVQKLLEDQKAVGGTALQMAHIDSWEVGSQNWTPGFREEFQKRRGYDLNPYLAVLTGRPVESNETTERFLWDLRRTVADLLLENYADHMREVCNRHGLTLSIEGYGDGPYQDVAYGGRADVPMCEFWTGTPDWSDQLASFCKEMPSAAHIYGKPICAAESFTSGAASGRWQNHPYSIKPLGDWAFTMGVNRFVFHRYAMQPWLDRKPGMTCGPFGLHYERTNTWWEQSRAWHSYVARCQALLQRGRFVADVACLGSENAPQIFAKRESKQPTVPPGYDFDNMTPEIVLNQITVRDGRVVIPSGMSYRVLVLPPGRTMTAALLAKIKELVEAGATIVGPPPVSSPSLGDGPQNDAQIREMAAQLWGDCDGESIMENHFGKGKVVWGKPLWEVLAGLGAPRDFDCREVAVNDQLRYIHRTDGNDEIYFVASNFPEAKRFLCTFRVKGSRPELWWPDTGRIEQVAVFDERGGSTAVPLALDPYGSVFVVFRGGYKVIHDRVITIRHDEVEISGLARRPLPRFQLQQEGVDLTLAGDGGYRMEVARTSKAGKNTSSGRAPHADMIAVDAGYHIEVARAGNYELKTSGGKTISVEVPSLPGPFEIKGPWELEFPKGWKAPDRVTLERLISWTDHPDSGVKYFSGTATYRRQFQLSAEFQAHDRALYLDLGKVAVIAEAKLNGRDLGILWKPPFRADITDVLRAGVNELEVKVVNLWPNRLIGDDMLPPDSDWIPILSPGNPTGPTHGPLLARYPNWLLEDKPSPTGHLTFTTWKLWDKNDALLESGLLGPVRIVAAARRVVT